MKYEEVDYINEDNLTTIKVKDYLKSWKKWRRKGILSVRLKGVMQNYVWFIILKMEEGHFF